MSFTATTTAIALDSYIIYKPLSSQPWTDALTNMANRNIVFKIWSVSYYYSAILLLPFTKDLLLENFKYAFVSAGLS